jgi:putative zinc finger/helix-turn-helix YgiT family protein
MTPKVKTDEVRKGRDRPFPWPCANCLKDEVYPVTMPYTTEVRHDGRTYKLTLPALRIPKCRACGELVFSNSVDDQIVQALRAEARLLTPQQIREGREALGLQSKEMAERLGVAKETLSRWETGMMIQSRAMDNFLRAYFAVPELRAVLQGPNQDAALGTTAGSSGEGEWLRADASVRHNGGDPMDERVARLKTPDECEQFALNVQNRLPDLARAARRRAVELRAAAHGALSAVERAALEAVYAYERVLSQKRGKKIRANRTWQMIKKHGITGTVERAVSSKRDPAGYTALAEMGMQDLAFEAIVVRYPAVFSEEAVSRSAERLREWSKADVKSPTK